MKVLAEVSKKFSVLDLGSSKISFMVAELDKGEAKILSKVTLPHKAIRQGSIINISEMTQVILKAKNILEKSLEQTIRDVIVSVSGQGSSSYKSQGLAAVEKDYVSESDIAAVLKTAKAVVLPEGRQLIHAFPISYTLDGEKSIKNPLGMMGVRLEGLVELISVPPTSFPNLNKCLESAKLKAKNYVLQQYASSLALLEEEEKDLGVALIDIGGGTADWILYQAGTLLGVGSIPLGGGSITHDISYGLRLSQKQAEDIKLEHGSCYYSPEHAESFEVQEVSGAKREVSRTQLTEIIAPRLQEIFGLVKSDIEKAGLLNKVVTGFVLTGGVSQTEGIEELASQHLNHSVRKAEVQEEFQNLEESEKAVLSCALGLIEFERKRRGVFKEEASQINISKKLEKISLRTQTNTEEQKTFSQQFKEFIGL